MIDKTEVKVVLTEEEHAFYLLHKSIIDRIITTIVKERLRQEADNLKFLEAYKKFKEAYK